MEAKLRKSLPSSLVRVGWHLCPPCHLSQQLPSSAGSSPTLFWSLLLSLTFSHPLLPLPHTAAYPFLLLCSNTRHVLITLNPCCSFCLECISPFGFLPDS